jgi:hypothetical protein
VTIKFGNEEIHCVFFSLPVSKAERTRWRKNIALIKSYLDAGWELTGINDDRVYFRAPLDVRETFDKFVNIPEG